MYIYIYIFIYTHHNIQSTFFGEFILSPYRFNPWKLFNVFIYTHLTYNDICIYVFIYEYIYIFTVYGL
jgi:hypothetical protein